MPRPQPSAATPGSTSRGGRYRLAVEVAAVTRALPPQQDGVRALDAGCGTARFSAVLHDEGPAVVGVDRDASMLAVAARRLPGRCARASAEELPFAAGTFDVTVAVTLLEFVHDPAAAMAELAPAQLHRARPALGRSRTITSRLGLSPPLVAAPRSHRVRQHEWRLQGGEHWVDTFTDDGGEPMHLVLTDEAGRPLGADRLNDALDRLTATAGVPRVTPHRLQHTAASMMIEAGADVAFVAGVLGHASPLVTTAGLRARPQAWRRQGHRRHRQRRRGVVTLV